MDIIIFVFGLARQMPMQCSDQPKTVSSTLFPFIVH